VAKAKKDVEAVKDDVNDFTGDLIRSLNKEFGSRIAYNLSEDEAPTTVKRWIDTGSTQLNYALRNEMFGGYASGSGRDGARNESRRFSYHTSVEPVGAYTGNLAQCSMS
jgi:hypothetical protein